MYRHLQKCLYIEYFLERYENNSFNNKFKSWRYNIFYDTIGKFFDRRKS